MSENVWKTFFNRFAGEYENEVFTRNTLAEVDFIEREMALQPGMSILDVGCGTGRHSLELARRGYRVTGLDLTEGMLAQARQKAQAEGLSVTFIQADATAFSLPPAFDLALCLCEGAFGLLGQGEEPFLRDLKILNNIHAALKPGGRLLMTVMNAFMYVRRYTDADVAAGRFDPMDCVETSSIEEEYSEAGKGLVFKQKAFTPTEMKMMFYLAGFETEAVYGGSAGAWKKEVLKLDEYEVMIWGKKK